MTCAECKKNVALLGGERCYDCELRRIQQLAREEKEARGMTFDWTADEILKREG